MTSVLKRSWTQAHGGTGAMCQQAGGLRECSCRAQEPRASGNHGRWEKARMSPQPGSTTASRNTKEQASAVLSHPACHHL